MPWNNAADAWHGKAGQYAMGLRYRLSSVFLYKTLPLFSSSYLSSELVWKIREKIVIIVLCSVYPKYARQYTLL